ncbi:MAG: glutamine-hydrolyzing GMP synthase subunit GuaA [Methanobacteriota archaeon]|nr:MAG: glutamine-hydrolyzing GMP synthase subunit GuaA [Euryarchaeota archaeon]
MYDSFIKEKIEEIRRVVGQRKAMVATSGGVDSSTVAVLAYRALGDRLHCIFVDHGLSRLGEPEKVAWIYDMLGIPLKIVDAKEMFMEALKGIKDPEQKRKRIGECFIRLFEREAERVGVEVLIQGTIAPDWVESGVGREKIKSHHNVGGLPERIKLQILEPLRELYKDEVRELAKELGIPPEIVERQPFPGPGMAVRIVGEVTPERLETVKKANLIVEEEIENAVETGSLSHKPWQYFAALIPLRTVGVKGDTRAYQDAIVIRAVESEDGMTADVSKLPWPLLSRITSRIFSEIPTVSRVFYDTTTKAPGTIELE